MYYEHFGFQSPPFSISPDPRFLYLSERHRDALAHLIYGAGENGGFVLLTGQVGTGKTTLIRSLLSQELSNVDIALCLHSGLSVIDFVSSILDELHIDYPSNPVSLKPLVDALNAYLLRAHAAGRQTVLIIDEGQNLSREVLEQVRLLTNLETDRQKLLRIILVGQEELQDIINRSDLRQLSQRITGRYHLTALNSAEVNEYIAHRIKTAKGNPSMFSIAAMKQVSRLSGGVPRLINVLCDRALLVAYNADMYRVTPKHIKIAAAETMPQKIKRTTPTSAGSGYATNWVFPLAVIATLGVAYGGYRYLDVLSNKTSAIAADTLSAIRETTSENNMSTNDVSRETSTKDSAIRLTHDSAANSTAINETVLASPSLEEIPQRANSAPVESFPAPNATNVFAVPEFLKAPKQSFGQNTVQESIQNPAQTLVVKNSPKDNTRAATSAQAYPTKSNGVKNEEAKQSASVVDTQPAALALLTPQKTLMAIAKGGSQTEGIQQLLKRWSLSDNIPAEQTACQFAETQQMQCLTTRGGLPLIRAINRPVLVELRSDNGQITWLPIVGFSNAQQLICLKNNVAQLCDTATVIQYWTGSLLALLRKPSVSIQISPGFEGEQIHWLRQRIAIAEKRSLQDISTSLTFDNDLVDKVKHFQQSRYIDDDGIIGNETLLYLFNVVADEDTPLLYAEEH